MQAVPPCTASRSRCSASPPAGSAPRKPPPHCSGASMQVPSIHRRKGLADSTRLSSRRPSCLEASAVEGETVTSDASRARHTCGGGRERAKRGQRGVGQQAVGVPSRLLSILKQNMFQTRTNSALLPQPLQGRAAACQGGCHPRPLLPPPVWAFQCLPPARLGCRRPGGRGRPAGPTPPWS